jgi:hypothetical protein
VAVHFDSDPAEDDRSEPSYVLLLERTPAAHERRSLAATVPSDLPYECAFKGKRMLLWANDDWSWEEVGSPRTFAAHLRKLARAAAAIVPVLVVSPAVDANDAELSARAALAGPKGTKRGAKASVADRIALALAAGGVQAKAAYAKIPKLAGTSHEPLIDVYWKKYREAYSPRGLLDEMSQQMARDGIAAVFARTVSRNVAEWSVGSLRWFVRDRGWDWEELGHQIARALPHAAAVIREAFAQPGASYLEDALVRAFARVADGDIAGARALLAEWDEREPGSRPHPSSAAGLEQLRIRLCP